MFCRTFVYTVRIANKSIPYNYYYYVLGSRVAEEEEVCSVDLLHCYNRLSMEEFPASKYKQTMHCWREAGSTHFIREFLNHKIMSYSCRHH